MGGAPMGGAPMGGAPMGGAPMGGAPAAGGSNMGRNIGIGCGILLLISCLCSGGWYACNMMAAGAITSAGAGLPSGGGAAPSGGGGSVCQRAVDCCNAYATTPLGASVAAACPSYNTAGMPDSACQSAIDGFRAGYTATGQAVPPACQ